MTGRPLNTNTDDCVVSSVFTLTHMTVSMTVFMLIWQVAQLSFE